MCSVGSSVFSNTSAVFLRALDPKKDVDGFHPLNMGRMLMRGRTSRFVPCTPLGVIELLDRCRLDVRGCKAVVLGVSNTLDTSAGQFDNFAFDRSTP